MSGAEAPSMMQSCAKRLDRGESLRSGGSDGMGKSDRDSRVRCVLGSRSQVRSLLARGRLLVRFFCLRCNKRGGRREERSTGGAYQSRAAFLGAESERQACFVWFHSLFLSKERQNVYFQQQRERNLVAGQNVKLS